MRKASKNDRVWQGPISSAEIARADLNRRWWFEHGRYQVGVVPYTPRNHVATCLWCCRLLYPDDVEHECMRLPTKEDRSKAGSPTPVNLQRGQMLSNFSNVWEYLTLTTLPGGKRRKPPRLSLTLSGSSLRLTANDDEACVYATWQGNSLDDLFLLFEEALATDSVDWKASSYGSPKGR